MEATVGTKVTCYRCSRDRSQYPGIHDGVSKMRLLTAPRDRDYPRKKKAKQKFFPNRLCLNEKCWLS